MTLEEQVQQYNDEQYAEEVKAEGVARPKNEWEKAALAMYDQICFSQDDVQLKSVSPVVKNTPTREINFI